VTGRDRGAAATIGGLAIPVEPDLVRMRQERHRRLQLQLEEQELAGLILLGSSNVTLATGAMLPGEDSGRAGLFRSVAVVVRGAAAPYLFTPHPDAAPPELASEFLRGPLFPDLAEAVGEVVAAVDELLGRSGRIGVDELTHPMLGALADVEWVDARSVLGPVKLMKTPDEVSCIRWAQRLTEQAMEPARQQLRPGIRMTDLSATFLRRVFELGASSNAIDPIWQVMAPSRAEGPWTIHGDLAYPTATTDRILREGDVIWVDAGITWQGYASDFGRTWLTSADPRPSGQQISQFERWRAVVDAALALLRPGVSALELGEAAVAANGGLKPWIEHFYLAHGIGTDSAEMPLVGTDLGPDFDASLIMAPGMVLVFEPVIWDEGAAGYRAEDVVVVTDDGFVALSDDHYEPFVLRP
jgi:Xaa-Pro aminopeptidase